MNIQIRKAGINERFAGSWHVTVNGAAHDALGWGEMLEVIIAATTGAKTVPYSQGPAQVAVLLDKAKAEELSNGLSDIACWARGFKAACPDDLSRHPYGLEAVTTLNAEIKDALAAAERKES